MKALIKVFFIIFITLMMVNNASADTTKLSPYSWDAGLYATNGTYNDTTHAWGRRTTSGAWGTGGVNYQSGSTINNRASSYGTLNVVLKGTYCPGACSYGSGTGYKGLVQFWNDPGNFIAIGLIKDPGVSPNSTTIMIEGAGAGIPVGGYWPANAITGTSHLFTFTWTPSGITVRIDNQVSLGPYPVSMAAGPSVSFLAAGRNTGDIVDTTFNGITFSPGSVVADPIIIPSSSPYFTYSATLTESGTGTGHSSYINAHDASNNAIAVGIQTDSASPESQGQPWYIWQRVQNGNFTYQYLAPASNGPLPVTLKWWKNENVAVFYAGATPIANVSLELIPRLFFNAEGNARLNGDSVNSTVNNVQIAVGQNCPNECGLNGSWNTSDFNFYGLTATNTNGQPQNGANFSITGTASGIPPGLDWDTTPNPVAGIGMIAQYWYGQ